MTTPVSYTHLDVYKRQGIDFKIMNSNKIVKNTVDYVDEVIKAEYLVEDGIVPEAEFI